MADAETVVRNRSKLTKPQLHALLMCGWARGVVRHGKGGFADKLEMSGPGLDKHFDGSMPGFDLIDKALDAEPSVLDDYFREKGVRLVDVEAVCDVDDLGLLLSRALVKLKEAEHPNGPGGRSIVPQEYLDGENLMRDIHAASGRWLEKCAEIRKPRAA